MNSKRDPSDNDTMTTTLSTIVDDNSLSNTPPMPIIDSSDFVERTFLIPINEDR